jgi:hypothetical protein
MSRGMEYLLDEVYMDPKKMYTYFLNFNSFLLDYLSRVQEIRITLSPGPKTIVAEDMEAFGEDCVLSFHLENIYRIAKSNTQNTIGVKDRWRQTG